MEIVKIALSKEDFKTIFDELSLKIEDNDCFKIDGENFEFEVKDPIFLENPFNLKISISLKAKGLYDFEDEEIFYSTFELEIINEDTGNVMSVADFDYFSYEYATLAEVLHKKLLLNLTGD